MTYDILIRHSVPVATGEGYRHHLEMRRLEAGSEEEAFRRIRQGADDHIACIDAWHHQGVVPFSVATGDPDFYTDAACPDHAAGLEPRVG